MPERWIADLLLAEVLSGLGEAWLISAAAKVGIGELNRIILPPADWAAEECARRILVQSKAVATRTGKGHG